MKLRDLEKDTKLLNLTFELSGFQPPINFSLICFATVISVVSAVFLMHAMGNPAM